MDFKEQYKKDYENIKPTNEFKASLLSKMEAQEKPKKSKITYLYGAIGTLAVAAAAVAIVLGVRNFSDTGKDNGTQVADSTENASGDAGIRVEQNTTGNQVNNLGGITLEAWYGSATTDEEKLAVFSELLENESVTKLYESSKEAFTNDDILSETQAAEVLDELKGIVLEEAEFEGEATYYMLVFENGDIIKFKISDEGYVKLNDMDKICKIK